MLARCADLCGVAPWFEVFVRFLRLGVTSFGGPIAHVGFFRREFVDRTRWLDDATFGEMLALCAILPGPTSSQLGLLIGFRRAGSLGALAAWLGFTLPSAVVMTAFGLWLHAAALAPGNAARGPLLRGVIEGLLAAAAGVVALAVVQMARTFAATPLTRGIALGAFALALVLDRVTPGYGWIPLTLGGIVGGRFARDSEMPRGSTPLAIPRRASIIAGALFTLVLGLSPILASGGGPLALFALCFRAGALVFGGGHAVLPFLASAIGPLVSERVFFAGYGAAQAMPGPLSTFAAFLGAVSSGGPSGIPGAAIALAGIFAPSFLLLVAVVPLWRALRDLPHAASVVAGLGAAVVGLLGAILVDPIAVSLVRDPLGITLAIAAFGALALTRVPAWAVVIASASIAAGLALFARA